MARLFVRTALGKYVETGKKHDADYVLGHSAQELERLSTQARLCEPFTMQFFRNAGIEAGMRVLDVGCGSGDVSFLAARMVGPTGQVVGVDRAPAAVATARGRSLDLQLSNTRFLTGDPGEMTFEEPFDVVVGRMVLMFCHDPAQTLRKVAAHVRPGGKSHFRKSILAVAALYQHCLFLTSPYAGLPDHWRDPAQTRTWA